MTAPTDIYAEQEARVQRLREKQIPYWAQDTLIAASWDEFYRQYPNETRPTPMAWVPEDVDWNKDSAQAARVTRSMDVHRKGVDW